MFGVNIPTTFDLLKIMCYIIMNARIWCEISTFILAMCMHTQLHDPVVD